MQGDCAFILPCRGFFDNISHLKEMMMKTKLTRANVVAIVAIAMLTVLCTGSAQAIDIDWPEPNWPEIFEPNQLRTLNLDMDPDDWDTIRFDLTFDIEVPAWFWMTGEEDKKIVVAVRRKSDTGAMPDANDPCKISLKIDINQYYCDPCEEDCSLDPLYDPNAATDWHGLKKLSLENGDGREDPKYSVLTEGIAINLHRMASAPEGYGYDNWRGNWVILNVNDECRGVYVSQEQHDKRFMKNRGLYIHHLTWLYKSWSTGDFELKVGDKKSEDVGPASPAVKLLCYLPFGDTEYTGELYPTPGHRTVALQLPEWINMQGLLTMGAVSTFTADGDAFYSQKGHNAYFLDFNLPDPCETRKRMYFPWDADSALGVDDMDPCAWNIYENGGGGNPTMNQEVILGNPVFRAQYNQIIRDLFDVNGPLSEANIHAFLDDINTPELRAALAADPYSGLPIAGEAGVAAHIGEIKAWISQRIPNVLSQVEIDEPVPPLLPPGIILLEDGFEGAVWDANWTGLWLKDTWPYGSAAWADEDNKGDFTCDALDASDATAIHIDFWFMKDDTDVGNDLLLYYFDGTNYDLIADLDDLGGDDEWLHYTDTTTDANYFVSDFKIRFNATPDAGKRENVWIDDVVVTKLTTTPISPIISGYILDPKGAPIEGVLVSGDDGGGSDTTDPNGYYEVLVPYGWSNVTQLWSCAVTPTKAEYKFVPTERIYGNVIFDQLHQDYKGTSIYDLVPDGFIDFYDYAVFASSWRSGPGNDNWNASCDFYADSVIDYRDLAKFVLIWLAL